MIAMQKNPPVVVNHRGMVTIPKHIRDRFGMKEGTKVVFVEVDGAVEVIPVRTVAEMEAACTIPRARAGAAIDEAREVELQLERDEP